MRRFTQGFAVAAALCVFSSLAVLAWQQTDDVARALPERVCLTWTSDTRTTQTVTWRTLATGAPPTVQVQEAAPGPLTAASAREVTGTTAPTTIGERRWEYHSATMTGLKPATLYAYRVGDGKTWSEWFQFRTAAAKAEPFSFLYFGDAQNDIRSAWSRVIRQAYASAPQARFMVFAGDLVNRGSSDDDWGQLFGGGGWIFGQVPVVPAPGNHEHDGPKATPDGPSTLAPMWNLQFALPGNGAPGAGGESYFVDYQDVRIVSLNSMRSHADQARWLDRVLAEKPGLWSIVVFHHPVYSGAKGRDNKEVRDNWEPVLKRRQVDLVLQGHDHVYGRSGGAAAPVFVVSVSGPKMYELGDRTWAKRAASKTQFYNVITVAGSRLQFEARTAVGEVYDAFELVKHGNGGAQLVERIPKGVPERLELMTP
jgi:3',5'-cyclic AMP phosphodiesterase CpdA